jgi:uncharacterized protein (DUF433 family)
MTRKMSRLTESLCLGVSFQVLVQARDLDSPDAEILRTYPMLNLNPINL